MKTRTAVAVFTLLALFALIQAGMRGSKHSRDYDTAEILINGRAVSVLLADTELKRIRGLSGKNSIGADGMLFVFPEEDFHGIWMKDMVFPIDLIWLRRTQTNVNCTRAYADKGSCLKVVDIKENVQPGTFPEVFYPREKARYVLEVNTGFVSKNLLVIGDFLASQQKLVDF